MTGKLQELSDIVLIGKNNGDILYTIGCFKKDHLYISKKYKDALELESEIIGYGWKDAKYRIKIKNNDHYNYNDNDNNIDLKEMYLSYLEYHYLLSKENVYKTADYDKLNRLLKELFT